MQLTAGHVPPPELSPQLLLLWVMQPGGPRGSTRVTLVYPVVGFIPLSLRGSSVTVGAAAHKGQGPP